MEGLITELPQPYHQKVFEIWEELSNIYNITKARGTTPIPHFSWHVAESYTNDLMEPIQRFLQHHQPPLVKTTGLGVFHGVIPVVYIAIQAKLELVKFHRDLIDEILPFAKESIQLYEPRFWTPHITLALQETTPAIAGEIIARYAAFRFDWEFTPDNIIRIAQTDQGTFVKKETIHM